MKKKIFLATLFMALISSSFAQTKFKEGYYINNANQKTTCLIKNSDWKNNPTTFKYRLTEDSEIKIASISSIKEFGISNADKYKRLVVDIDRSSNLIEEISLFKEPIFKSETLFLKVLVEGNATLYSYESTNLKRYFFSNKNKLIEQLVYKKYLLKEKKYSFGENNYYKQQLSNNLKCEDFSIARFENLKYHQQTLVNLFNDYNTCGIISHNNSEKRKDDSFFVCIKPGINNASFTFEDLLVHSDPVFFGNTLSFHIGLELESILPFNNNKWALFIEPAYNYYKSESTHFDKYAIADLKLISIPVGVRHYIFLSNNSKLYTNVSYSADFWITKIDFELREDVNSTPSNGHFGFGFGYKYNKYSIEVNYDTSSNPFFQRKWAGDYQRTSLIIGYNLFNF